MNYIKKILFLACCSVSIHAWAQDSVKSAGYGPLPQSIIKILQDTTLPELVVTKQKQVTKNIHRMVDSLYGKKYPFDGRSCDDCFSTVINFILQKGNYIFVVEVYGGGRFGEYYGHLIVFNPTLSDSLSKVVYYEYNYFKSRIVKTNDLVNASSGNNFKRQTEQEYKHEH